jgi:sec-independent protein translocase protein TatA
MDIGGPEILIILLVVVLLFGGAKLPKLARSLGSAKGEFEKGLRDGERKNAEEAAAAAAADTKAVDAAPGQVIDTTATPAEDPSKS